MMEHARRTDQWGYQVREDRPTFHNWERQAALVVAQRRGVLVRSGRFNRAAELAVRFFTLLPDSDIDELIMLSEEVAR